MDSYNAIEKITKTICASALNMYNFVMYIGMYIEDTKFLLPLDEEYSDK